MHFSPKWFRDRKIAMKLQTETDKQIVQDPLTDNGNSTQEKEEIFVSSVTMPDTLSSSASSSMGLVQLGTDLVMPAAAVTLNAIHFKHSL